MPPLQATLGSYIADTLALLRDNSNRVYSPANLATWVNKGIARRDIDLGLNRVKYGFTLTPGVYQYTFAQIQGGTLMMGPASTVATDVLSIVIVPLGFATSQPRYPLGRWPYSMVAPLLATSYPSYPVKYATYGPATLVMGPPPASTYPCEFDFFGYTPPLVNQSDVDPIPYPWTDPIPYYAAHLACIQDQNYSKAKEFYNPNPQAPGLYQTSMATMRARGRPLAVANPWANFPTR